jgi:hypothetical protein
VAAEFVTNFDAINEKPGSWDKKLDTLFFYVDQSQSALLLLEERVARLDCLLHDASDSILVKQVPKSYKRLL